MPDLTKRLEIGNYCVLVKTIRRRPSESRRLKLGAKVPEWQCCRMMKVTSEELC